MFVLPPLKNYTKKRPGKSGFEERYLIPNPHDNDFWDMIYRSLFACGISSPVLGKKLPNNLYGYYGLRMHPATFEPHYFHLGLEYDLEKNNEICAVYDGVLEYSGYNAINGHYVLISHPHIQTEDGYILHSMYCHLKKPLLKFNSYQKMLREISLGSYPEIPIHIGQKIGLAGTSGITQQGSPRLYIQFDFRKLDEVSITLDPAMIIYGNSKENISADIKNKEEFFKKNTN